MSTVKVMSYNLHFGVGTDGTYDLARIAEAIEASGANVVGLQEVDGHWSARSRYEHMAESLASRLNMQMVFAPIYELPPAEEGRPVRRFGVALLSRFPIVRAANRRLTRLSTQSREAMPERMAGLAEAVLDVAGIPLTVYVAHLDYRSDPAIRTVQVGELLELVGEDRFGKLIVGDFNAGPNAPELQPLFAAFRDTWSDISDEAGFTFPAAEPASKIDYILAGEGLRTIAVDIAESLASDHRPIMAELELIPRP